MTDGGSGRELAASIGRVGLWTGQLDFHPFSRVREVVARLEELDYGALWFIEAVGRESLTQAALLLGVTNRMVIGTGITSIWGRDAMAMAAAHRTLTDAYGDRFVLGLGVSHPPLVEKLRGHRYQRPLDYMRRYLDAMDSAPIQAPLAPEVQPVRVLAALGPRMMELAAERTAGALTYLVTPEHTEQARSGLGPGPLLAVEQAVVVTSDRAEARRIGRAYLKVYLSFPAYLANWERLGFTSDDFTGGGSDRLVDAMVLAGDAGSTAEQLRAHYDAGADHVCIQVLDSEPTGLPQAAWEELAPVEQSAPT
jgi:probable F420-dependent oxidoreductase